MDFLLATATLVSCALFVFFLHRSYVKKCDTTDFNRLINPIATAVSMASALWLCTWLSGWSRSPFIVIALLSLVGLFWVLIAGLRTKR
tara:strand:+ start:5399 stop:5662 length:264 start_codon:yes stop_codon:yes gene_type:complete